MRVAEHLRVILVDLYLLASNILWFSSFRRKFETRQDERIRIDVTSRVDKQMNDSHQAFRRPQRELSRSVSLVSGRDGEALRNATRRYVCTRCAHRFPSLIRRLCDNTSYKGVLWENRRRLALAWIYA